METIVRAEITEVSHPLLSSLLFPVSAITSPTRLAARHERYGQRVWTGLESLSSSPPPSHSSTLHLSRTHSPYHSTHSPHHSTHSPHHRTHPVTMRHTPSPHKTHSVTVTHSVTTQDTLCYHARHTPSSCDTYLAHSHHTVPSEEGRSQIAAGQSLLPPAQEISGHSSSLGLCMSTLCCGGWRDWRLAPIISL